jgi:hypothetical protein
MSAAYQRPRLLALAGLAVASCAPLVSYDGFRGGAEADASDDGGDGATDATDTTDAIDATDAQNGCLGAVPGVYCGRNLPNYTGSVQDLVHCLGDGTMGTVTSCTATCVTMPAGRQDVCNPCAARADGPVCLQEIVVTYPDNDVRVVCTGGNVSAATLCPNGCASSACL